MHRSIPSFALALVLSAFAALPALADRVDVPLRVGESASGEIVDATSVSTCAFLLTEGDKRKLSVAVKRSKGSRMEPEVTLIAPDGSVVDVVAAGGKLSAKSSGTKIKLTDVPQSGLWRVEVRGADGSTGAYSISTKAKEGLSQKANYTVTLGDSIDVPITVGDAQSLSISAKRAKKASLVPGIEILAPNGEVLQSSVGASIVNTKKGSAKLKKLPLPSYGTYTVRLSGLQGTGGGGVYSIKTSASKLKGKRPTADPGPAFAAEPTQTASLDGSASEPSGSGSLDFIWTQVAGPTVALSDRFAERPSFTAPADDGTLAFQLAVSQSAVQSAPKLVVVEVTDRPIADPGRTRVVAPSASVALDGGGSIDRNAAGLSAAWRIIDGPGTLTDAGSMTPTFDAPSTDGVTRLGLIVDDGRARSFESELLVVATGGTATAADAGREQYVGRMATVFLSGLASHRDADALDGGASWEQISGPSVTLDGDDTFFPSFQAPRQPADLLFELTVDGADTTSQRTWVHVRTTTSNRAPTSDAGNHATVLGGSAVLNASGSADVDGGDPVDRWGKLFGAGGSIGDPDAESTTATGLTDTAGIWLFSTQARDDLQYGAPDLKRVAGSTYSGAPLVSAGPNRTVTATTAVTLEGVVTQSPNGGGLTYSWRQVSGREWFDIAAESGTFNPFAPRPTFRLRDGISSLTTTRSITLEFTANDAHGDSLPDYVTVTFTGLPRNGFPVAQAAASTTNPIVGANVALSATGSDPDGDPVTFRWAQVSGPTVTLQGGPTAQAPTFTAPASGTIVFDLFANDGINDGQPSRISIVVDERPTAVASVSPAAGGAGEVVTFNASGSSDPEGEDLSYTWTQVAGTALMFDADAVSFAVAAPNGGMSFRLVVNDGRQDSLPIMATYSENAPPSVAPMATVGGTLSVQVAYGNVVTLLANPSDTDPATFTWRQIGVGATSPAVTLSSTSAQNPTFTAPAPTVASGRFGSNPQVTFGVTATREGISSTEQQIAISLYASFNDTTLPTGAPTVWPIISANCSRCHSGSNNSCPVGSGSNATGFGMGSATAFISNAVNVRSCNNIKPRVSTAGASNSFLVDRINGQGGFMPPGGSGIALRDRLLIMDWADQGASGTR